MMEMARTGPVIPADPRVAPSGSPPPGTPMAVFPGPVVFCSAGVPYRQNQGSAVIRS
jgi:hypothetical protein